MKQIVVAIISITVVTITLLVDESASFVLKQQQPHAHHMNIIRNGRSTMMTMSALSSPPAVPVEKVIVLDDAEAVGQAIRDIVTDAAKKAIEERGYFALAIPGGSILKMLSGDIQNKEEWTTKTIIAYVNHKCVPMDDIELATHAKAKQLFLNSWGVDDYDDDEIDDGLNVIVMDGTNDGIKEAASYEQKLKFLSTDKLPIDTMTGFPIFDLALIGVGDDGHIGSLYPNRHEVLVGSDGTSCPWVLPVEMKEPPSITLSLPIMQSARQIVVAACGVSDKYPQGKSAGMKRAVSSTDETLQTFPAVGLRESATWVMDKAAASALGDEYNN